MRFKWLIWGFAVFIITGLVWFVFVILSVITLGKLSFIANIFGVVAACSLPAGILLTIFSKKKNK